MAEAKHNVDDSNCLFNWLFSTGPAIRNSIRLSYELDGSVCGDIFYSCLCPQCAAAQLYGEAKARGPVRGRKVVQQIKPIMPSMIPNYAPTPVVVPSAAQMMGGMSPMGMSPMGGPVMRL